MEQSKVEVVEIDETMLELIKKLSAFSAGESSNGRSLTFAKTSAKKRKRKEFAQQHELATKLDLRYLKSHTIAADPLAFTMPKRALPRQ